MLLSKKLSILLGLLIEFYRYIVWRCLSGVIFRCLISARLRINIVRNGTTTLLFEMIKVCLCDSYTQLKRKISIILVARIAMREDSKLCYLRIYFVLFSSTFSRS